MYIVYWNSYAVAKDNARIRIPHPPHEYPLPWRKKGEVSLNVPLRAEGAEKEDTGVLINIHTAASTTCTASHLH